MKKLLSILFSLVVLFSCERESAELNEPHSLYQTRWEGYLVYPEEMQKEDEPISIFFFSEELALIQFSGKRYPNIEYLLFDKRLKMPIDKIIDRAPEEWLITKQTRNTLQLKSWYSYPDVGEYMIYLSSN